MKKKKFEPIEPEVLCDILGLVDVEVPLADVQSWTDLKREMARLWASRCHLSASDNKGIKIPPKPAFLKKYPSVNYDYFI